MLAPVDMGYTLDPAGSITNATGYISKLFQVTFCCVYAASIVFYNYTGFYFPGIAHASIPSFAYDEKL